MILGIEYLAFTEPEMLFRLTHNLFASILNVLSKAVHMSLLLIVFREC